MIPSLPALTLAAVAVLAWPGCCLPARSQSLPNYEEGDRVIEDVVTTIPLAVTDYGRTERLRREKAGGLPSIFRFQSRSAVESELALRQAFAAMRTRFGDGLEIAAKRRQLDARTVEHPSFGRFVQWFETQNPRFPVTRELARLWAMQEPDERILAAWIGRLNQVMNQCIHPDELPADMASELSHVRIVPMDSPQEDLTAKAVVNRGVDVMRTNLVALTRAKAMLDSNPTPMDGESPLLGPYLAGFVTLNCFPEAALTRQFRDEATHDLWAVDRYPPGHVLAQRGQLLDARAKAAIDLLRSEQSEADPKPPQTLPSPTPSSIWSTWIHMSNRWMGDPLRFETTARSSLWALAGLSVAVILAFALLVNRKRAPHSLPPPSINRQDEYTVIFNPQRNETIFLPQKRQANTASVQTEPATASNTHVAHPSESVSDVTRAADHFWQQRALEAERRAEEILKMVRAGLAPQLARQMMNKLVQELISQRADWLKTQQIMERDLTEIEHRFARSHALLLDRLTAFEKRTEELEKALAVKTEENTELIKAHIAMAQQKVKPVKTGKEVLSWN